MNTILDSLTSGRSLPLPWTVASLLAGLVDWDAEFGRLLDDELPPSDSDIEPHDD